jgi:hypothetical protein
MYNMYVIISTTNLIELDLLTTYRTVVVLNNLEQLKYEFAKIKRDLLQICRIRIRQNDTDLPDPYPQR